ncbi:MAG: dTDP-4-dehydrorhamnose reductase [Gammaproteobacteria bacterium RIFCSPHIGHO2_12_FULL_37_34]|nr:MAG: dTDP-4-dehydrorhamnose reductase [Gammaproteobacteria bacterium RIFCSPHIGHO2_12_FULL_37_34]
MGFHVNNSLPKLLVTGGNSQLACALRSHPAATVSTLVSCTKEQLDITHTPSIKRAIKRYQPDIIINTAAYTAVDKAEKNQKQAMQVNDIGAKNLALICEDHHILLIHFSTDYVFDGSQAHAYQEIDSTNPINVYGLSKWLGECAIRQHASQHIILRISGLFSEYGNNFLKTILHLAHKKNELQIVYDQITCPTYAGDVATVLFHMMKKLDHFGTYHYCNTPSTSWYDFAIAIMKEARKYSVLPLKKIHSITSAQYAALANRPTCSNLNCDKIYHDYGIAQSSWQQHVTHVVRKLFL